jgi:hypothetical protein
MKTPVASSVIIAVLLVLLAGCTKQPFVREPLQILRNPNPDAMRYKFERTMPERFTTDDTVIVQAPFHDDIAILSVIRVDRSAGTFEIIGLNHTGVKLFDLRGDQRGSAVVFALPPLMKHQDLLLAVAKDIQRMYLDLIPDNGAKPQIESDHVRFNQKTPDGTVVYNFGNDPPVLLEKYLDGFFGSVWRVGYYQYSAEGANLYPHGIVMDNSRFHYRIIVKNRDVEIDP